MDAIKFLKEQVRMCENSDCSTCELHKNNNKTNVRGGYTEVLRKTPWLYRTMQQNL